MQSTNRTLFWFRDHLVLKGNELLNLALAECSELIPVYCFDPREPSIKGGSEAEEIAYSGKLIEQVSILRDELTKVGSNLLVVSDFPERSIPSIARVLHVNRVITNCPHSEEKEVQDNLSSHRMKVFDEVKYILNLHSIPFNDLTRSSQSKTSNGYLPEFPEINAGVIPSIMDLRLKVNHRTI